jgi:hypothetical protein
MVVPEKRPVEAVRQQVIVIPRSARNDNQARNDRQAQNSVAAAARISVTWATDFSSTHSSSAWAPAPVGPMTTVSMPTAASSAASIQ